MLNEEIEMARQDKKYKRRSESREGLLRAEKAAALRPSLEEACRSSLDSDEHLDELDLNSDDNSRDSRWGRWSKWSCLPTRPPWSTEYTYQNSQNKENPNALRHRRWLARRRSWLIVALILALGFSGLVGSGALWVYNSAPPDGVRRHSPIYSISLLTPLLTAITAVVSNSQRRHPQRLGRELQESISPSRENESGRKSEYHDWDRLVDGFLCRIHWTCQQCRLPSTLPSRWPTWTSLFRP